MSDGGIDDGFGEEGVDNRGGPVENGVGVFGCGLWLVRCCALRGWSYCWWENACWWCL